MSVSSVFFECKCRVNINNLLWIGVVMAREFVWLECVETGAREYRINKETKGSERLQLKKYNRRIRKHTLCKESRKK